MKSTGMVRKVDELGRVVLPIELRRSLKIDKNDEIEIYVDDDKIILKKYTPDMTCQVTGKRTNHNTSFADGNIVLSPEGAKQLVEAIQNRFSL